MCEEKQFCTESEDLGHITFSDSTKSFYLPFNGKKKVFYKDSLSNISEFDLLFTNDTIVINNTFGQYKDCPSGVKTVRTEVKLLFLICTTLDMKITYHSRMNLTGPNYSKEHEETFTSILFKKEDDLPDKVRYFSDVVFQDTRNSVPATLKHINITLFGKEYKDVIIDKKITPTMCYLDKQVGIRAFRDFDNKLWVFDRFE